jgi:hypothetical protein
MLLHAHRLGHSLLAYSSSSPELGISAVLAPRFVEGSRAGLGG